MYYGSESTAYLGPKIWEIVPVKVNEFNSPNSFIKEIRNSVAQNYPCRLRKQYISDAGFLPRYVVVLFIFKVFALSFFN